MVMNQLVTTELIVGQADEVSVQSTQIDRCPVSTSNRSSP